MTTRWRPMDEAPQDGTPIIGNYGEDGEIEIRWAEERVCMLAPTAPGAGMFGPGWEDTYNCLYADDPISWRPVEEGPQQ